MVVLGVQSIVGEVLGLTAEEKSESRVLGHGLEFCPSTRSGLGVVEVRHDGVHPAHERLMRVSQRGDSGVRREVGPDEGEEEGGGEDVGRPTTEEGIVRVPLPIVCCPFGLGLGGGIHRWTRPDAGV